VVAMDHYYEVTGSQSIKPCQFQCPPSDLERWEVKAQVFNDFCNYAPTI